MPRSLAAYSFALEKRRTNQKNTEQILQYYKSRSATSLHNFCKTFSTPFCIELTITSTCSVIKSKSFMSWLTEPFDLYMHWTKIRICCYQSDENLTRWHTSLAFIVLPKCKLTVFFETRIETRSTTLDSCENQVTRMESSFQSFKNQESNELIARLISQESNPLNPAACTSGNWSSTRKGKLQQESSRHNNVGKFTALFFK